MTFYWRTQKQITADEIALRRANRELAEAISRLVKEGAFRERPRPSPTTTAEA